MDRFWPYGLRRLPAGPVGLAAAPGAARVLGAPSSPRLPASSAVPRAAPLAPWPLASEGVPASPHVPAAATDQSTQAAVLPPAAPVLPEWWAATCRDARCFGVASADLVG